MALPTSVFIDDTEYYIYQSQFSGGERKKSITEEMTITGKRSRQFGWLPREWEVTLWLQPSDKTTLETIWEEDGASSYNHTFRLGAAGDEYDVTIDSFGITPHAAVEERYLAKVLLKEWL